MRGWHAGGMTDEPLRDDSADDSADAWDGRARRPDPPEEEVRRAWGSWRQDRELNRRKVLRSLVGLVVISVLTGLLAYGCSLLRSPRQVKLNSTASGLTLQSPTSETVQLTGAFEAAGADGATAGHYRGTGTDVLLVAGYGQQLPTDLLSGLLPPVTGADLDYTGSGGPINCGATSNGSRCVWKSGDLLGGTAATGVAPDALERLTRDLRTSALG
jgi:hypothetical protein